MEKTLSLTSDDGPDERWTGRILEALSAADARATSFMVSELAAWHALDDRQLGYRLERFDGDVR